jgi:hypothetical protein
VQRIEDTKLRLRIEQAVELYYARRDEQSGMMDNDFYSVVNAGVIFPRRAGAIFLHFGQQEGPRARGPSCCPASLF